jgi:stage V sporulation protein AC
MRINTQESIITKQGLILDQESEETKTKLWIAGEMMEQKMEKRLSKNYKQLVQKKSPDSKLGIDCVKAFIIGGLICVIGQIITNIISGLGVPKEETGYYVATIMVFLGAFLTGIGLYDDIGKFAGAGSIVPITGFANSIVSPAMEFKTEGYVLGVGAKMFVIAGPVLVYGISTSVVVGIVYYFIKFI